MSFVPATRRQSRLRMSLAGPTKAGKSFTSLRLASAAIIYANKLAQHNRLNRIAVISSEPGNIQKYVGAAPDGWPLEFDVFELADFAPKAYRDAVLEAGSLGYDMLIIDSLSHEWAGEGGVLSIVDSHSDKYKWTKGWRTATPAHNQMIESIIRSPCHIIATMRSKMGYVMDQIDGKNQPKKVGLEPVQRADVEYEFDICCDISGESDNAFRVTGSRCPEINGMEVLKPGADFMLPIFRWLDAGTVVDPSYWAVSQQQLTQFHEAKEQEATAGMSVQEMLQREGTKTMASQGTLAAIKAQFMDLKATPEQMIACLKQYGAAKFTDLTEVDAGAILDKLTEIQKKKVRKIIGDAYAPGGPSATKAGVKQPEPSAAALENETECQCTVEQRTEIKDLLGKLNLPAEKLPKLLDIYSVKSFRELSIANAADLLEKLRAKATAVPS